MRRRRLSLPLIAGLARSGTVAADEPQEIRDRPGQRTPSSRQLLPLIAAYQRFYEVEDVDDGSQPRLLPPLPRPERGRDADRRPRRGTADPRLRLPLLALHATTLARRPRRRVLMKATALRRRARHPRQAEIGREAECRGRGRRRVARERGAARASTWMTDVAEQRSSRPGRLGLTTSTGAERSGRRIGIATLTGAFRGSWIGTGTLSRRVVGDRVGPAHSVRAVGVDRPAVDVDLEVEVAADRERVAGLADLADPLPRPDPLALADTRPAAAGARRSSCGARLRRGSAGSCRRGPGRSRLLDHPAARGRATSSVPQAATMSKPSWVRPPLRGAPNSPIGAAGPVRPLDREDVAEVRRCRRPVGALIAAAGRGAPRTTRRTSARRLARAQWCSMTRSTMLYSFASSALMK